MKNNRMWLDYTKVRSALKFNSVLNHYKFEFPVGKNQVKIHCPFHEDKTPSLSVNLSDNKWHCFGCNEHGNTLEFVIKMEGYNPEDKDDLYKGAETAISIMGLDLENFSKKPPIRTAERSKIDSTGISGNKPPETQPRAKKRPTDVLRVSEEAKKPSPTKTNPVLDLDLTLDHEHPYLQARGVTADLAKEFNIGFCAKGLMKDRIAFAIRNESGDLVAYAGRRANDEEVTEGVERYKLPKDFYKSLILYNLDKAKQFKNRHLVIVEGFWSVLRLHQAGIPAVALLGSSCSPEQAALLADTQFRFVTLLLDGDEAGRAGTPEAVFNLSKFVYVRALELPEGIKPDTMDESWFEHLR